MPRKSIVFVVAHPDDVAFSFGGTAWLLKDQYRLHVLCASRGERGYDSGWKGKGLQPPRRDVGRIRTREEQESCRLLGAELCFLGEPDGEIQPSRKSCDRVTRLLTAIKPAALITHSPFDKLDHSATFSIAYLALQRSGLFWTTDLYMGEAYNLSRCNVYVDITRAIDGKRRQIACHRSHLKDDPVKGVQAIVERNRTLGQIALCPYAEAYVTAFPLANARWGRKAEPGSTLLALAPEPTRR